METISFNKNSLNEFINSDNFSKLQNIPISKLRAISQINNPRADDEDILLVAQFDRNITAGYLGILPDYVFIDGEKVKIVVANVFLGTRRISSKVLPQTYSEE